MRALLRNLQCVLSSVVLITVLLLNTSAAHARPTAWRTLAPGLEYTALQLGTADAPRLVHAFRVDPNAYRFDLALAKDYGLPAASVRELGERSKAMIAINGGFFSPENMPLGLRIQNGRVRSALKGTSWWGVFALSANRARIVAQRDYQPTHTHTMAVQAGPRLVVGGTIPSLKGGLAERSGLGITRTGRVVIAATEYAAMTTNEFAELFRTPEAAGGLGCPNALNLDGGRSTQLYARLGQFRLHIPNLSLVTDAVVVKAK